ncbi:MAG: diphosphomevalonate decarboxylase, partial [Bdellovibrionales bacterium]|nr:diphosphomevalonate decarboxylase [Bdellovibrionales bacterium]
ASSFAALTFAVAQFAGKHNDPELPMLSARGSGSSSRSFQGPWCEWNKNGVTSHTFAFNDFLHGVILVSAEAKTVSSSQAHVRVTESLNFQGRPLRAEMRLSALKKALIRGDWRLIMEISWAEFWDMHSLFETSEPCFGYMEPGSLHVLKLARKMWTDHNDGPVVTMDAGANVHVFWRKQDQRKFALQFRNDLKEFKQIWSES